MSNNDLNREYEFKGTLLNGFAVLFASLAVAAAIIGGVCYACPDNLDAIIPTSIATIIALVIMLCGLFTQQPNKARVMIFFGNYRGTCRRTGFFWVNPFITKKSVSLRLRNMNVGPIKVNDKVGNPVMIGMVLVWKVKDTYRAVFDVDQEAVAIVKIEEKETPAPPTPSALDTFVNIQSDAALREVTSRFAYDDEGASRDQITLRSGATEIVELLEDKLNERLAMAGVEIVEARLNYLAYAPEIAAVMLRRQQASAIIAAREKIVEGAVSMVKMALDQLDEQEVVELDPERKATMVSNLLVVLCADEPAQPVVSTGGLYH